MQLFKNILLTTIFTLLFGSPNLFGQSLGVVKAAPSIYREYGFDLNSVLRHTSLFGRIPSGFIENAVVIRKHTAGKRGATRWIINVGSLRAEENEFVSISVNWGKEYHRQFGKRWAAYSGFNFSIGAANGFSLITNRNQYSLGAAPIYGIRLKLNSAIYLSSEGSLDLQYSRNSLTSSFSINTRFPSIVQVNFRFGPK